MSSILRLADGQQVPVRDGLILGRVKCDVVIDDTKASRRHARIIAEAGVLEIEDLGSSNGTFLNGVQIDRKVLRPGDRIQIGRTVITLEEAASGSGPTGASVAGDDDVDLLGDEDVGAAPRPSPSSSAAPSDDDDVDLLGDEPEPPPEPGPESGTREVRGPRPPAVNARPVRVSVTPPDQPDRGFEIVEFEDEVVQVRPSAKDAPQPSAATADEPQVVTPRREVLQYNKKEGGGGLLGDDLSQLGGWQKGLLVGVVLAAAVGLAYVAMSAVA